MRKVLSILSILVGLGLIFSALLFFDRLVTTAWEKGGMSAAISFLLLMIGGGSMFILIGWLIWEPRRYFYQDGKGYDVHPEDLHWEEDMNGEENSAESQDKTA